MVQISYGYLWGTSRKGYLTKVLNRVIYDITEISFIRLNNDSKSDMQETSQWYHILWYRSKDAKMISFYMQMISRASWVVSHFRSVTHKNHVDDPTLIFDIFFFLFVRAIYLHSLWYWYNMPFGSKLCYIENSIFTVISTAPLFNCIQWIRRSNKEPAGIEWSEARCFRM